MNAPADKETNIQKEFYDKNKENLENRFPDRIKGDRFLYLKQNIIVFGGAIIGIILLFRSKIKFRKTYNEVAGWDVSAVSCVLNLIFAFAFGFVAVVNDWWFFFPDAFSGIMWHLPNAGGTTPDHGYMVLGDVVFYLLATIMGHLAVLFVLRLGEPARRGRWNAAGKLAWFLILFTVGLFGITFGSNVMQGMVLWLYLPFGLGALIFFHRFSAMQVWIPTALFIVCEFIWDALARIMGVWIFPDASTHPGLYIQEITLFHIGNYPLVWQPEMTQMAFVSGMICLVFFFLARMIVRGESVVAYIERLTDNQ